MHTSTQVRKIAHHLAEPRQDIQFYYTGTEQCEPGHSWGPGMKDHYKITYVHSGKGIYKTGGQQFHLTPGSVFLLTPDQVGFYQADQYEPWSYSWVAFNGSQAEAYLRQAGLTAAHPVMVCHRDQEIRQCLNRLFDAHQHCLSKPLQMTSALYAFLSIVLESASEQPDGGVPASRTSYDYVSQAVRLIESNYSRSVTIEELAQRLGLNRKYFTSLFKSATGIPPQQYLRQYRLDKACSLLRSTRLSVKEISCSVGYSDQMLFSRMFKKAVGQSPSQYRNG